jgi:CYTH domain-containing protein
MSGPGTFFEIERRFLVRIEDHGWEVMDVERHLLRQGYIRSGDPSIRIRTGEPRGPVLTCKSGKGVKRHEVETVVPEELAVALFEAAEERVIEKIRWRIGPWELDRFVGGLDGLFLLEIELEHEDDPVPEPPAGIRILREVTEDKRFTNGYLARLTKKKQGKLVKKAYKEVKGWKGLGG